MGARIHAEMRRYHLLGRTGFFQAFLLLAAFASAAQSGPAALTQRRINEIAAALESAHSALIEGMGTRHPGELLPETFAHLAAKLPQETPAQHKARVERYLAILSRAVAASAPLRRMPALNDTSAGNRQVWQRAVQALDTLASYAARLRAQWPHELPKLSSPVAKPDSFDTDLAHAVWLVTGALRALRDAQP